MIVWNYVIAVIILVLLVAFAIFGLWWNATYVSHTGHTGTTGHTGRTGCTGTGDTGGVIISSANNTDVNTEEYQAAIIAHRQRILQRLKDRNKPPDIKPP